MACEEKPETLNWVSKLLALWIAIAIVIGLALGKYFPEFSATLQIGIPIGLFFMIYPAMTKIEIGELKQAVKSPKQTSIIVFFNYLINPFLLFALGYLFFEVIFPSLGLIDLQTARYLWTGLILLGVAPCIAMVLVWTDLCKGNGPLGIVLMAWNSIIQIIATPLFIAVLVGTYISIDIVTIGESILLYLGLPLLLGAITRREVIKHKSQQWLNKKLIPYFDTLQLLALLATMVVMFALRGGVIIDNPSIVWQMAIPVTLFFFLLFNVVYFTTRRMGYNYQDSSTMAFHSTGRNFELAIAIALTAFASMPMVAVSTVVGPLIEIPVMLTLVSIALRRRKKLSGTNGQSDNQKR
ncbi:MAG: bile acid:sodium symporter [Candidatus Bathyarchaeota archaeon]|nr:bile acid:sodium symporter [Candidatus Bathyarchaeota archaeon]